MILRHFLLFVFLSPVFILAQENLDSTTIMEELPEGFLTPLAIIEEEIVKEFAPDFEMTMLDGSIKKLSDYRGKVVYVSFWASWCGPCIKGFNRHREMREDINGLGVVMLNVSIDKDVEKWKAAIDKHDPTGIHAIVPHDVVKAPYQMYNVPRYEIVGKKGQFLYLSDEPGRDILENFKQFMEL